MSYTDRFRVDANFQQPTASNQSSSSSRSTASLHRMIEKACNPTRLEPDLGLNLEIADLINQKKGSFPREAAVAIAKLVNSRTPQTSILAMGLLDICVKNCGYPFQLQISRKEFLNELVRKFPERPPYTYTRTQMLILEAIEEWRETICKTSRYKEDLGYIRDMHRLLSFKGYVFPEVNHEDAAVLNPSDSLRSAQELEDEERDAQSAKLQELIRRATPADLQEANRLMGIMAGYKNESKTDYHARAAQDLDKLRRKAGILEEMINNNNDTIPQDEVFTEMADALKNAHPKIVKMAQDERESDQEAATRLTSLADYVQALTKKYDLLNSGDIEGANKVNVIRPYGSDPSAPQKTNASNKQLMESLIDIDDDDNGNSGATDNNQQSVVGSSSSNQENLIDALDGLSFGNIALGGNASSSSTSTPPPSNSNNNNNNNNADLLAGLQTNPNTNDDGWTFSSALPAQSSTPTPAHPSPVVDVMNNPSSLKINFKFSRSDDGSSVNILSTYSNNSPTFTISQLNFQLAVPKSFSLNMEPQSGTSLQPFGTPVTQSINITPSVPQKLRWKVSYMMNGAIQNQDGQLDNLPSI